MSSTRDAQDEQGGQGEARPAAHRQNRLAHESSPYLLQHAGNPVDWYPWGAEAFARARAEDKPIFLSIGYSACHWCHVMERESFEDAAIAALMNDHYVCIKVDREERPDVDELYMKAVQALTQGGGWPMSVWLTPDLKPFFGGTYFPPADRFGRAGFPRVLTELARLWKEERPRVLKSADGLTDHLREMAAAVAAPAGDGAPGAFASDPSLLPRAAELLLRGHDEENGGFGEAPKFPHPMDLQLLLRIDARFGQPVARQAALRSLEKMAAGGIHDQLAGGFHRYSVDERWAVPHFEKMLYDNALLAQAYLDGWQVSGDAAHAETVRTTLEWALREMRSPGGGFCSTQDADSEGEEGKYFVWDPAEFAAVLGAETAAWAAPFFGVAPGGNFEHGKTVLWRPWSVVDFAKSRSLDPAAVAANVAAVRAKLLAARAQRIAPNRDDKVLADWNGLLIGALARAGALLDEPRFVAAAGEAAAFVRRELWRAADGSASGAAASTGGHRLLRSWKDGRARHDGNLADYAFLIEGLLCLWEARFEPADLAFARELADATLERFWDDAQGGFFFTAHDAEALLVRSKEAWDGATPSGPSVLVDALLRLSALTGADHYRDAALRTLELYRRKLEQQPHALSRMLAAVDFLQSDPVEVVLIAPDAAALAPFLAVLREGFAPNRVVLAATPATRAAVAKLSALLEGRDASVATAWVCRRGACRLPVTTAEGLEGELASGR
ncbi:MAG: thioredoxin domain-containing protein [Planctomycetes bacterium]|nr:thioredoxin domain-containing protein [Planctomycetota bacterium]